MNFIEEGIAMELLQMKYYKAVVEAGSINGEPRSLDDTCRLSVLPNPPFGKELGCTPF